MVVLNQQPNPSEESLLATYTCYKAEEAGRTYIEIDPRGTSQRGSRCVTVVKKDLSVRVHQCPVYGATQPGFRPEKPNSFELGVVTRSERPLINCRPVTNGAKAMQERKIEHYGYSDQSGQ